MKNVIALFLMIVLNSLSMGQKKINHVPPRIPAEIFFKAEEKTDFKISPDGKNISFIVHEGKKHNLFIQNAATGNINQLTQDSVGSFPEWNFINREPYYWMNNETILFCKTDDAQKIYSVNVKNKLVKCFTDFPEIYSAIVSVTAGNPYEILISSNKRDKAKFDLYRLNIKTGEMKMTYENSGGNKVYFTDSNGDLGVVRESGTAILKFNKSINKLEEIVDQRKMEYFVPVSISADNKILYAFSSYGKDKYALVEYDLEKKKEAKIMWEDKVYDIYSREERNDAIKPTANFYYSYALKKPLYAYYYRDDFQLRFFDDETKKRFEKAKRLIGNYDLLMESFSDDLNGIIFKAGSGKVKGNYYYYNHLSGKVKLLHKLSGWLNENDMAEVKPIEYKSRDGKTIHGYLTIPKGIETKHLPLVVYTHGGPWLRDTRGFNDISQFFANRGYLVLECDYRGSSGYGNEFMALGYKQLGQKMQNDITDGVEWLIKKGMADKSKVAIYGFSSGGLNVLAGLAFTPDLYACGASVSGLIHQINSYKIFGQAAWERFGNPVKDSVALRNASPYFFTENIKVPVILAYGVKDRSIPIKDIDEFAEKLKKQGNEVDYLRYENYGHNLLYVPEIKLELFRKMESMFERCFNKN